MQFTDTEKETLKALFKLSQQLNPDPQEVERLRYELLLEEKNRERREERKENMFGDTDRVKTGKEDTFLKNLAQSDKKTYGQTLTPGNVHNQGQGQGRS